MRLAKTLRKIDEEHRLPHRMLDLSAQKIGAMNAESLGLLLFAFFATVGLSAVVYRFYTLRRRRQHQIALARQRARSANSHNVWYPLKQRKAHIEAYLVTKPVLPHDLLCDAAREQISNSKLSIKGTVDRSDTVSDEEGGASIINDATSVPAEACTICFESFEPLDLVSWSPNPACCKRVFHHSCFKEWLLQNKHCPWCRETVLPVDGYSLPKTTKRQVQDLLLAQQQRSLPAFYCCTHGMVRPTDCSMHGKCAAALDERYKYLCSRAEISAQATIAEDDTNISSSVARSATPEDDGHDSARQDEWNNSNGRDLEVGVAGSTDESDSMNKRNEEGAYDTGEESMSASGSSCPEEDVL